MEIKYLNQTYTQTGGLCIISAYGILLEYYSKQEYQIDAFFKKYLNHFKPSEEIYNWYFDRENSWPKSDNKTEDTICAHYHYECARQNIFGLEFVKKIHGENLFKQVENCKIEKFGFQKNSFSNEIIIELKEDIKAGGWAMVYGGGHAVVLGYDDSSKEYITRDPERPKISREDFLSTHNISEYLLFIWA